jgi:hypothetical protein
MAKRGQTTTFEERLEIGERWQAGQTDPEIAVAMNHSMWVVRKWRRVFQKQGQGGLVSRMGRPPTGALGHFTCEMRQAIRQMRETHPGRGPLTIRTELEQDQRFAGQKLPDRSRIAAYLKQEGFTRKYERHTELPQEDAQDPQHPHEEWEVDAQGVIKVAELGSVSIINISDLFSRLKVDSFPCLNTSHPNALDYQLVLRRAFLRYGLPERISLDHDGTFYDNTCASPYPMCIHMWLIALGITVRFIEQPPPAEHSVIERMHQTVTQQAIVGQTFIDGATLQDNLTERLDFLNYRFPSRSLGGRAPLLAYPDAQHSGRPYRPEWEDALLDLDRVYQYLAQGRWFRQVSEQGQFSIGAHRYGLGKNFGNQTIEITFVPQTCEFKCRSADRSRKTRLPALGLTKSDLMGELSPLVTLPAYQLALPFSPSTWREMLSANALTGTT